MLSRKIPRVLSSLFLKPNVVPRLWVAQGVLKGGICFVTRLSAAADYIFLLIMLESGRWTKQRPFLGTDLSTDGWNSQVSKPNVI